MTDDPLFICVAATGIAYCDRTREEAGDHARIGFLPFATLDAEIATTCPPALRGRVASHMEAIRARRGEDFRISTSGQTVRLGHALPDAA